MARQIVAESGTLPFSHCLKIFLFCTGKDHTNKPMIAVYGCYFPDPAHVDYDALAA